MKPTEEPQQEWITTANEDNDCAIFESESLKLIGVGSTPVQTINIVTAHNASLRAAKEEGGDTKLKTDLAQYVFAFAAAQRFIESNVADWDITPEMKRNYQEYLIYRDAIAARSGAQKE